MATVQLKVKPFEVPDRVVLDMPPGRKQDGIVPLPQLALSDVPRETLEALIAEFAENVMAAAGHA